jgi:RNA polymerase sigma factor (sigma-70 family)
MNLHSMERADPTLETPGDSFDQLVARYYESIGRLVFRLLGWRDGSEDLVQEVFLSAWAAWPRFSCRTCPEFWLKRIAVNKCRSRLRREAVRTRWFRWFRAAAPRPPDESADSLSEQERAHRVRQAIRSLAAPYREVTILYYLEQMSVLEIAQVVNQRRNTVEVKLHRARRQLEQLLSDLME